jgi:four helix bundle protein
MEIKNYKDLNVWKLGMEIAKDIYILTNSFPKEEIYGITSQMRRSSLSIPSNLAEGHTSRSKKEFYRFVSIARGSLAELETQIEFSQLVNLIKEKPNKILEKLEVLAKMLNFLQKSLTPKP